MARTSEARTLDDSPRESRGPAGVRGSGRVLPFRRAPTAASWDERVGVLFDDLRKPARVMIGRAFGSAITGDEIDDIYANAWTSTLSALKGRAEKMDDTELRSYLLTAVANHASKEMRRRRRKPTSALEDAHAQVLADSHQPSPEERAVGSEATSMARDVLSSLPPRRRAVMLLRYGWGLEPKEICGMVDGLSPRAYRKEITRGVGDMIDRLRQAETGEWCESREPLIRDYVAGTADEEATRQAAKHVDHCHQCGRLLGQLQGQLNDLGAGASWTAIAGTLGEQKLSIAERLGGALDRGSEQAGTLVGKGQSAGDAAAAVAASGGARGAGAAGAGIAAKLAGLGLAGKAAVACLGAGVAATACVAVGVVDVPGTGGGDRKEERAPRAFDRGAILAPVVDGVQDAKPVTDEPAPKTGDGGESKPKAERQKAEPVADEGAPLSSPAPTAPPEQQEFGLPAAAASGGGGSSSGGGGSGGGGSGGSATGGDVAKEFGP